MNTLSSNLSQSERLEYYAGNRFHEQEQALKPRFPRPPSIAQVREHDARLMLHGSVCNVAEDVGDDEESEESELRDYAYAIRAESLKEHSLRLPSQRSRADVRDALRFMGLSYHD